LFSDTRRKRNKMSLSVEKLEGSMAKLTITVPAEEFSKALTSAYNKNKNKFQVPGFRKGKVPMAYIEKMYGTAVFYEDAANDLINEYYPQELENCDLDIVSRPEIGVEQIEKGKDFIFTATVAVKPEITLGEYKGIEIEKIEAEVTEEDVMAEIQKAQKDNSRMIPVTDRAAKLEDEVTINFEGFIDGVAFDGGKGENYGLVLGSHSFIDTFEDQLVGTNVGDKLDVNVTFPEDYQAADLAGKPAVFKVEVLGIKEVELPELDDEFASEVSSFDTFEEYKEDTRKTLETKKASEVEKQKESKVIEKLIEASTIEIPEPMITYNQEKMIDDFSQKLAYQGLSLDQYLQFTQQTKEAMMESVKPEAIRRIQSSLVVEAVAKAEKIEATEEELNAEIEKIAGMYQLEVDKFKELAGDKEIEAIKMDVCMRKAMKLLVAESKEV
jgi:trigger factor